MNKEMTSRQRWLAALDMKSIDRLPFWPKLSAAYPPAQKIPFRNMTFDDIYEWIGSDRHYWVSNCIKEIHKNFSCEVKNSSNENVTIYRTKFGELCLVQQFDKSSQAWHPVQFPVKGKEDIKLMTEFYRDIELEIDNALLKETINRNEKIGGNGLVGTAIGESPLMYWVEFLAGIENAHFFLADYQDETEELFEAIHQVLLKKTEITVSCNPADVFYFFENTSTTLISPQQYKRYCFRHLSAYASFINEASKRLALHMCGHLKDLLPDLARIKAHAFEAFTSPTLGNTTLFEGRTVCPDKCLIGGTNAMLWTKSSDEIINKIKEDLDVLPHHRGIVVTSAGVMPPSCPPETIKQVCDWIKEYPVRN